MKRETIHNQHRRSFVHDYREKGTYMVTMVVEGRKPVFGHIEGHAKGKPGTNEAPHMVLSELGRQVLENIKRYMAENPFRARIRQECPKLMERQLHLWIARHEYAANR